MATPINLSGLSSGIDTQAIIQQLMQAESQKLTLLKTNMTQYSDKKTAVTELESKINSFETALGNMSSLAKLKAFNTATGDSDIITASASASATEGSHSVEIKQLATAERLVHSGAGFSSTSSLVGEGTFVYSYNNKEVVETTKASTTLQELVTKINGDANNPGVTASLLEYNDGTGRWHMVLAGKDTGVDNQISINTSNTELKTSQSKLTLNSGGTNATASTRINDLANYTASTSVTLTDTGGTLPAKNHVGGDVTMTFAINSYSTVQDLMDAVENAYGDTVNVSLDEGFLKVTDKTSGTSLTDLKLSFTGGTPSTLAFSTTGQAGGTVTASLAGFGADKFTWTQRAQDAKIKVDGYPQDVYDTGEPPTLIEEKWMSRATNSISDVIDGVTLNLQRTTETEAGSGKYNSVSVSLTRNTETVKSNLNAMIEAYNSIVSYIKDKTTYNTDNKKMGILSDSYSLSSISALIKSPLQSMPGGFTSSDTFTQPQDIGLKIDAKGVLQLDSAKFDEAVSKDYGAVLRLIGAQQDGSSSGDDSAYISFSDANQYTQAGSYDVKVQKAADGTITAQIKLKTESTYRDMKVEGNTLYGDTTMVASDPMYPEYSLALTLDPNAPAGEMTTSINLRQGFGDKLYDMVNDMLKSNNRIDLAKTSINKQISDQQDRIDTEQARLVKYQASLQAQYARLETTLNSIQQQMATVNAMMK